MKRCGNISSLEYRVVQMGFSSIKVFLNGSFKCI